MEFESSVTADVLEAKINRLDVIRNIGEVSVIPESYNDGGVFKIIYITRFGVNQSDIPDISVVTNSSVCKSDSNLTVQAETVQALLVPEAFNLGFDAFATAVPRYTDFLPLNTEAIDVEDAITELFGWECSVSGNGQEMYYQSFEDTSDTNATSYCGRFSAYQEENLLTERYAPDDAPYVSLINIYGLSLTRPIIIIAY